MNKALQALSVLSISVFLAACGSTDRLKQPTAAERTEQRVMIKTQLAAEYMNAGDYRQAVATIEEALRTDSRNVYGWLMRAQIYHYLKVPDKADESFRRALAIEPGNAEVNNNYGWFLCDLQKRYNDAMPYFDRALADPTYPSPFVANMNKGICSTRMGQYNLAESYFQRALSLNPNFFVVQKEMARAKLQQGQSRDADYLFRQYQSKVDVLSADDLLLGWRIARSMGHSQAAYEYEAQIRANYPYSNEMEQITTGKIQ